MGLTRREFLKWAGFSAGGAVVLNACGIPEQELRVQSPAFMPEDLVKGTDNWYATLCRQHDSGCGIVVRVMEGRAKKIEGNLDFPINRGSHLASCEAGLQSLYHPDRIAKPLRRLGDRGSGSFQEMDWGTAMDEVVGRLRELRDRGEADTVVMVTNPLRGHLGMVTKRFADSYGATYMPYEALEDAVYRETVRRLFGQEVLPDLDLENTRSLLSFGADFLGTWVSPIRFARGYGHFRQGESGGRQEGRGTFVQVESRLSHTGASADQWVPIKPGMEGALALSIANVLIFERGTDGQAADTLFKDIDLERYRPEAIAEELGIPRLRGKDAADTIRELARRLDEEKPSLVIGGGTAAAHTNGLANLMAIYSLNYLLGSVNKPGGLVFNPASPFGDISASASGASFEEWHQLVDRFRWGQPRPVNMMLVYNADPLYGLPGALDIRSALKDTFIVSFSNFLDDTTAHADLVLPIRMYLEDWGDDIPDPAPQYQTVGFQQPVVNPPPGIDVKGGFGDLLLTIAEQLGGDVKGRLPWKTFRDVVRQGARELFGLPRGSVKADDFDAFWTGLLQRGGWWDVDAKADGSVPTPPPLPEVKEPEFSGPEVGPNTFYLVPFAHVAMGDGRNAHLPWLQATPDPISTGVWSTWVEMNSRRAEELGLVRGDVVELRSEVGSIEALVYPNPSVPPDLLAVPVGQGHIDFGRYAKGRGFRVFELIDPQKKDEAAGSLAWAATRVWVVKTSRRKDMPRFEGNVPPIEPEAGRIIKTTRG